MEKDCLMYLIYFIQIFISIFTKMAKVKNSLNLINSIDMICVWILFIEMYKNIFYD